MAENICNNSTRTTSFCFNANDDKMTKKIYLFI